MTKQTKSILKTYFDTGDIPTQGQYRDLIDSQLTLAETGTQVAAGTISSSFLEVENDITVSGNISASGNITASGIQVGSTSNINISPTIISNVDEIRFSGNQARLDSSMNHIIIEGNDGDATKGNLRVASITASNGISASGTIFANDFQSSGGDVSGVTFHDDLNITGSITASGNISASGGDLIGSRALINTRVVTPEINTDTTLTIVPNITASSNISASGNITGATGSFDNGIILTAPNGNKFRFVVNNSGHLFITGSAI